MPSDPTSTLNAAAPSGADQPEHPEQIGGYRILGLLGEGGMGRVYHARELNPPRDVALKVVRGLDREALQRFRREAELLASLEHPGIARLYATGDADFGGIRLPWFALEYVHGDDVVTHARSRRLDLRARIALLIAICRAVHYAHGRGVIHRDLKPGNLLVDADGQPHVLDFGIARLLVDGDGMTQAGQVLGTVPYMSPEQLAGRTRDVDVRSDVYALGVIAYELIADRLPHPRLSTSTVFEALQIVRDETPPRLATLAREARGDLDRVVMKALATDPAQRYGSSAEFAADLERVLDHRPVEARPPTVGYLAARFVRRHRALSAAAAAIMLVLAGATAVSLRFAFDEARAREEAVQRGAEAEAVSTFLAEMLRQADPDYAQGSEVTVASVLDRSEAELAQADLPPRVRLILLTTIAETRVSLGQYEQALALNDAALTLLDAHPDLPAERRAWVQRLRAWALTEHGRFDEARSAIAAARSADPDPQPAARIGLDLTAARLDNEAGKMEEAEAGYRAVLAAAEQAGTPSTPKAAEQLRETVEIARSNLSSMLRDRGALDEALTLGRAVLDERIARYGERDPRTLVSRQKLALTYAAQGDNAAAEREARAALDGQREVLGDRHDMTLTTMQSLANALLAQGKLDEAEALTREAMAGFEAQFGEAHAQTVASMNALAYLLEERKQVDAAEALYRRILDVYAQQQEHHPETLAPRNNLAMLLLTAGRLPAAAKEFETLLADATVVVGEDHPIHAIFSSNYGLCLSQMKRLADARRVLESAHARLQRLLGPQHARSQMAAQRLADVYAGLGMQQEADALRAAAPAK